MSGNVILVLLLGVVLVHAQNKLHIQPPYSDGYKTSWKTMKTEKYETETIDNPHSDNPDNKYIVKSTYKVRAKLPYDEVTVGYDREILYPIAEIDHEHNKNEKIVDFNHAKSDPFPGGQHDVNKKPQKVDYFYQYPENVQEYQKNVHLINSYIGQTKPKKKSQLKQPIDDYHFDNNVHIVDSYLGKENIDLLPKKKEQKKQSPKDYSYDYEFSTNKFPSNRFDYIKLSNNVDFEINHNSDYGQPKTSNNHGYGDENDDSNKHQSYHFDNLGPSGDNDYAKYKTDEGPSYDYLASDYSHTKQIRVPFR